MEKFKMGSYDAERFVQNYMDVIEYMAPIIGEVGARHLMYQDPHDLVSPVAYFSRFNDVLGFMFRMLADAKQVRIDENPDGTFHVESVWPLKKEVDGLTLAEAFSYAKEKNWFVISLIDDPAITEPQY